MPLYYDRYITSQTERLEEAIERNAQRIMELQREMDRRFTEAKEDREALRVEVGHRFAELREEINRRFETIETKMDKQSVHMRNWVLVAVALISMIMTILQVVLK